MRARIGMRITAGAAAMLGIATVSAAAQVPMSGTFTAEASCFATQSIRSEDNPGRIVTEPGKTYRLLGRNDAPGSHYLILVPGAEPERRWVAYGCGRVGDDTSSADASRSKPMARTPPAPRGEPSAAYVLAASWQPAFCEIRSRVPECRLGGRAGAGFSLHGLWPQPNGREYCGVPARIRALDEAGDWRDLPDHDAAADTRLALAKVMPGVASGLDRHEWWTHGTCHGGGADTYFADSIRLLAALNASSVHDLFEASIGETLTSDAIRRAFDEAFGRGAGHRVLIDCAGDDTGRRLIQELRISLRGRLDAQADLGRLIQAAETMPQGCREGEVDAAGLD